MADRHGELQAAKDHLVAFLDYFCKDVGQRDPEFHYRWIEARVKDAPGVIRTLDENAVSADELWTAVDDLIGTRIIVVTKSMAHKLADEISRAEKSPIQDPEMHPVHIEDTGYRAIHIKGRYRSNQTNLDLGCEIQIRTELEDAWAVVSRTELYSRQPVPEVLKQTAHIEAEHLQAVDRAFDMILNEVRRLELVNPPEPKEPAEAARPLTDSLEPIDEQYGGLPPPEHTEEEEYILRNRASESRVQEFLESFMADRQRTATTEELFERVGAFQQKPENRDALATGFNVLVRKGPFVEGSNWLAYPTWDFAVALEEHLIARLEADLRAAVHSRTGTPVTRDAGLVIYAVNEMASDLKRKGYDPTVIVLTGPLGFRLQVDLLRVVTPRWALSGELSATFRILGVHEQMPIMDIAESPDPSVYVVDLARFAGLARYADRPEFAIEELDDAQAQELLDRNPDLVTTPPPLPDTPAERLRQLSLKVGLRLYERYELMVRDPQALLGRPLVGEVEN